MCEFLRSDVAVTAIEYALIGSLIALVIIASVTTLGQKVLGLFTTVDTALS